MPNKCFPVPLLGVSLAFLPIPALAQSKAGTEGAGLDPIVVTATLGPETVGESLSSVTVIDQDTIRRQQPAEFRDLLRAQPGINVVSDGSYGKTTSVFLRGAGSSGTVLLLDGIRLRSATAGIPPWQFLPTDLIDRVELVRGAKSSLYGADAVGGVVQAFTLTPSEGQRGWVDVAGGSHDTRSTSAGLAATEDNTSVLLGGLYSDTDGTNLRKGGDDRGYRNAAGLAKVSHRFERGGGVGVTVLQSQGNTEFEGGDTDFMIRAAGLHLEAVASDYWRTRIQFSESRDEQETFGDYPSVYNTLSRSARWENTLTAGVHELVLGSEISQDEVDGSDQFAENSRTNTAVFGQGRLNFGATNVTGSLRMDDNEAYGRNETGGIALGHELDRSHRVRLSYATSFRAPTFNDLYLVTPYYSGNPDLRPEKGRMVEAGFSGRYQTWFWDVAVYQNEVRDLITYDDDRNIMDNVETARIQGVEWTSGYRTSQWDIQAALTYADAENRDNNKRLPRRARKTARLDVDRLFDRWSMGATLVAEGNRYNDEDNRKLLPGYGTMDLRGTWQFLPGWSGQLKVANVFDRRYAASLGYDSTAMENFRYLAAGRTFLASVRYDFGH
ncbi:outer membrane receptor for transport of vitamin B [Marinobacter santoriniensis NKSG1]|uniref:Outer membrane receptor for transport of vitamin B n=1 Tax=Marinobacter santoriniensis NKSG1 TaxID=1288826 RepID=M7D9D1_9GAMM|nr:TonB-dependent receptor [Marinobacter santoriniensis]EMP54277.1 outer membrane receptor for transport of vitamin B [Marinobacter santoriniensis NKSG1]